MAKYFNILILFSFLLVVSCQEGREAGDLLGQWRLTGTDSKYISFSGSIVWFKSTTEGEVFGKFQHVGDSLFIQCSSIYGSPADTTLIEDSFGFKPFADIHLKIEALSSDKLVIGNAQQSWSLYKY